MLMTESMEVRVHLMLGVRKAWSNWTRAMAVSYAVDGSWDVADVELGKCTPSACAAGAGAGAA